VGGPEYKPAYERAVALILERFAHPGPVEEVDLRHALGLIAARDVPAPSPFPPADLSMMDGHAFGAGGPAGRRWAVLTGEALPPGVAGVVPHEEDGRPAVDPARWVGNVVRRGAEYAAGELVAGRGQVIDHARVSQLALLGVGTVAVHRRPRIRAGVFPGQPAAAAVSAWLEGFLAQHCAVDFRARLIGDPRELPALAEDADLVLAVSDGAPGRYPRLKEDLLGGAAGFEPVFWKLALNPCRHVGFGTIAAAPVLVLPDVFFKTVIAALAFLPPLLSAWGGARLETVTATWASPPDLRHPLPCLVPLRFEGGCLGPGLAAVAAPLHSTFSARGVADAGGFTIVEEGRDGAEPFEAVVLGRLVPGPAPVPAPAG
jgi:molybdopterin molybdotransferase